MLGTTTTLSLSLSSPPRYMSIFKYIQIWIYCILEYTNHKLWMFMPISFVFCFLYLNHISLSVVGWSIMERLLLFCDYMQVLVAHIQWSCTRGLCVVNCQWSVCSHPHHHFHKPPKNMIPIVQLWGRREGGFLGFFMFSWLQLGCQSCASLNSIGRGINIGQR